MNTSTSRGFSLIEVMIGVSILGIAALAFASLFSMQYRQVAQIDGLVARSQVAQFLTSALSNQEICSKIVIGSPFSLFKADQSLVSTVNLDERFSGTAEGTKLLTLNEKASQNSNLLIVKSVTLEKIRPASTDVYYASLTVGYANGQGSIQLRPTEIPLLVKTSGAQAMASACSASAGFEERLIALCESLKGTWNLSTRSCTPQALADTCSSLGGTWDQQNAKCKLSGASPGGALTKSNANEFVQGRSITVPMFSYAQGRMVPAREVVNGRWVPATRTIHFDQNGYACLGPCKWLPPTTVTTGVLGVVTTRTVPARLENSAASFCGLSPMSLAGKPFCCENYGSGGGSGCQITAAQMAERGYLSTSGLTQTETYCGGRAALTNECTNDVKNDYPSIWN